MKVSEFLVLLWELEIFGVIVGFVFNDVGEFVCFGLGVEYGFIVMSLYGVWIVF